MSHDDINQLISKASKEAFRRCGLSDHLYSKYFEEELARMNLDIRDAQILTLAEQEGYCSGTDDYDDGDSQWCKHGFTFDTCPLGCGEG
jgi:hypothetical protein